MAFRKFERKLSFTWRIITSVSCAIGARTRSKCRTVSSPSLSTPRVTTLPSLPSRASASFTDADLLLFELHTEGVRRKRWRSGVYRARAINHLGVDGVLSWSKSVTERSSTETSLSPR